MNNTKPETPTPATTLDLANVKMSRVNEIIDEIRDVTNDLGNKHAGELSSELFIEILEIVVQEFRLQLAVKTTLRYEEAVREAQAEAANETETH